MKTLQRFAVLLAMVASTLTVATPAAHAACTWGPATYGFNFDLQRCGSTFYVKYNRAVGVGHAEIWEQSNTNHWRNGRNGSFVAGDSNPFTNMTWSDRTCAEYWIPDGSGGWSRLDGEIDCNG
jgi:hypothetical protein